MDCLSVDAVLAFVSGQLSGEEEEAIHAHLGGCVECRTLVAETAKSFLSDSQPPVPAPGVDGSAQVAVPTAQEILPPGTMISRYLLSEPLGTGATGVVYEAHDSKLKRKVALKLLRPQPERSAALIREAEAMARLAHPNVVAVYDAGIYRGDVFIVMELVDGETLSAWLRRSPRSWREIVRALVSAGHGLHAIHAMGLVHRDFKPENVLVGSDGRVRVTDFGLARSVAVTTAQAPGDVAGTSADTITAVAGTPAYMAPEQFSGKHAAARSDQFSFCVALFMALHGRHPFGDAGPNLLKLTRDLASAEVRSPSTKDRTVPARLDEILLRGLRVNPAERYESLDALVAALTQLLDEHAPIPKGWRRKIVKLAGAASLAAAAAAGYAFWTSAHLCGNARTDRGEECDDGNGSDTDGCLTTCRWAGCGDGKLRAGVEECDDGNTTSGDGCSAGCLTCTGGDAAVVLDATGHCYTRHDQPAPWHAARQACEAMGRSLVTITSSYEGRGVWSGLFVKPQGPGWIGLTVAGAGTKTWITGEVFDRAGQWVKGEPKTDADHCVFQTPATDLLLPENMYPGSTFTTAACDRTLPFVCEYAGWTIRSGDNHGYRIFPRPSTWAAAETACETAGGHLVTITDAEEQAFVAVQARLPFWIGATDARKEGTFEWTTGRRLAFDAFSPGEPDDNRNEENCVVVGTGGAWHDRSCVRFYPYMCEID